MSANRGNSELSAIPLFPLPNVVLFPRAILPLHIFEERYKAMTADALRGRRQIAMALLRPGWEKSYHAQPAIESVVCIGAILTHQKLPDGTYNLLLQGHTRARVADERCKDSYRVATLEPLVEKPAPESKLRSHRAKLTELFQTSVLASTGIGEQFAKMLAGPLPTPDVADLIAFNFVDDVCERQTLLGQTDVYERVAMTVTTLSRALAEQPATPFANPRSPNLN